MLLASESLCKFLCFFLHDRAFAHSNLSKEHKATNLRKARQRNAVRTWRKNSQMVLGGLDKIAAVHRRKITQLTPVNPVPIPWILNPLRHGSRLAEDVPSFKHLVWPNPSIESHPQFVLDFPETCSARGP